ncbi:MULTISPECIES: PepSY-associated TM helix domain-containing protein [unclassified Micromonospora]|uniref:PepSY-associated TM helix domain-containing protein n=1 Tax=unclassified Micromonospora TaxID=2617518 RepID=UPI0036448538
MLTAAPGGPPKSLAEQVTAARATHPEGTVAAVLPGTDGATTRVVSAQPDLGDRQHTVYVDPHTAAVKGQLTTWFDSTPATTWLDDLHRNLHLGDLGRHYSEIAASWLWLLVVGGVILWWRRRGAARTRTRHLLVPDLSARKGVRRTRAWHATTGIWLTVGLLFLSATGLTWSRYAGGHFGTALDALRAGTPDISTSLAGAPPPGGGQHPVRIAPAEEPGSAWTVAQTDNTWPVARDRIAVDPVAGTVTARSDFADWPLLAFVVVDVVLGILARRRRRAVPVSPAPAGG